MKKVFILKKKNQESYLKESGIGFSLVPDKTKAKQFTYSAARETMNKVRPQYGSMEYIAISVDDADGVMLDSIEKQLEFKSNKLDLGKLVDTFSTLKEDLLSDKEIYYAKLKRLERARLDLSHFEEFNKDKFDTEKESEIDGLKERITEKRREVKNNIRIINTLYLSLSKEFDFNKEISKMNSRIYTPREFDELFESGDIPSFDDWWGEN